MRTILFILISFVALTVTFSGLLLIGNPDGDILKLSLKLLEGTYFHDFLLPGILLLFFIGSPHLLTVWLLIRRDEKRYNWALASGILLCSWIIAQVLVLKAIHWVHFVYFFIGLFVVLLALQLKGKWVV